MKSFQIYTLQVKIMIIKSGSAISKCKCVVEFFDSNLTASSRFEWDKNNIGIFVIQVHEDSVWDRDLMWVIYKPRISSATGRLPPLCILSYDLCWPRRKARGRNAYYVKITQIWVYSRQNKELLTKREENWILLWVAYSLLVQ